jgi:hypothetical protein
LLLVVAVAVLVETMRLAAVVAVLVVFCKYPLLFLILPLTTL